MTIKRAKRSRDLYAWNLGCDGVNYVAYSDHKLGSMMHAFRTLLGMIANDHGQVVKEAKGVMTGTINIDHCEVERTTTQVGFKLFMKSGDFEYTAYTDHTLESWIAAMSGAMKFFAAKYGVVYLYEDVARNVDRAHEDGFER